MNGTADVFQIMSDMYNFVNYVFDEKLFFECLIFHGIPVKESIFSKLTHGFYTYKFFKQKLRNLSKAPLTNWFKTITKILLSLKATKIS